MTLWLVCGIFFVSNVDKWKSRRNSNRVWEAIDRHFFLFIYQRASGQTIRRNNHYENGELWNAVTKFVPQENNQPVSWNSRNARQLILDCEETKRTLELLKVSFAVCQTRNGLTSDKLRSNGNQQEVRKGVSGGKQTFWLVLALCQLIHVNISKMWTNIMPCSSASLTGRITLGLPNKLLYESLEKPSIENR